LNSFSGIGDVTYHSPQIFHNHATPRHIYITADKLRLNKLSRARAEMTLEINLHELTALFECCILETE
jgi:hypothetical protein